MISLSSLSILLAAALVLSEPAHSATVAEHPSQREATRQLYTQAHSLGHTYKFPARDGWTALNITDMQYKYRRSLSPDSEDDNTYGVPDAGAEDVYSLGKRTSRKDKDGKKKAKKAKSKSKKAAVKTAGALAVAGGIGGLGGVVGGTIDNVDNALEGFGNPEPVVITWYTGQDLQNPSCWAQSVWAPTDASFVAALTLEGWNSKPECYKFLELCNGPDRCVFVRVVDTCAGCASGSKHVDLTRAAFGTLADFDLGILTVQMRPATDPSGSWLEDLWGPKV